MTANHHDQLSINRLIRETLAVVMAGGRGSRLHDLTANRSKPAVPFGGKFRIIDFTLSNCINSGIRRISLLTQYNAHSLIQHLERGWSFCRPEFNEFIELLPAQERHSRLSWYLGTADSVYQNLDIIRDHSPSYVLVLAGDHIYKMDYGVMIATHVEAGADATVGCVEVPIAAASQFGLMVVDSDSRVVGFQEKPEVPVAIPGRDGFALASMGIYLFSVDFLCDILERDAKSDTSTHDFGKDILPSIYQDQKVVACPFNDIQSGEQGYWRDVGTIDAYWQANLELTQITPPLNLYDQDWPIRTYQEQLPPAKFIFDDDDRRGYAIDSMVSSGCIISGSTVKRSLVSNHVRVNSYCAIEDSVILPDVVIGRHCNIRRAIIDTGCQIPPHTDIGIDPVNDRARFRVTTGGVVLVCPDMLGQKASHAA